MKATKTHVKSKGMTKLQEYENKLMDESKRLNSELAKAEATTVSLRNRLDALAKDKSALQCDINGWIKAQQQIMNSMEVEGEKIEGLKERIKKSDKKILGHEERINHCLVAAKVAGYPLLDPSVLFHILDELSSDSLKGRRTEAKQEIFRRLGLRYTGRRSISSTSPLPCYIGDYWGVDEPRYDSRQENNRYRLPESETYRIGPDSKFVWDQRLVEALDVKGSPMANSLQRLSNDMGLLCKPQRPSRTRR